MTIEGIAVGVIRNGKSLYRFAFLPPSGGALAAIIGPSLNGAE